MAHLFFCCAPSDRARLYPLYRALQTRLDYDVWMPEAPEWQSDDWYDALELAIEAADGVIFAVTEAFQPDDLHLTWLLERIQARFGALPNTPPYQIGLQCASGVWPEALAAVTALDAVHSAPENVAAEVATLLPVPVESPHPFVVERQPAPLVGREATLTALYEAALDVAELGRGIVALTGAEGVGKTELALAYAYRYRFHYPAGVYWINAAHSWTDEVLRLARQLNFEAPENDAGARLAAFYEQLQRQPGQALIILDGVQNSPDVLDRRLGTTHRLNSLRAQVIITTAQSALPAEVTGVAVGPLTPEMARAWLRRVRPNASDAALEPLIEYAQGMPLVLKLVVAALRVEDELTPEALAAQIETEQREAAQVAGILAWHRDRLRSLGADQILVIASAFDNGALPVARLRRLAGIVDDAPDQRRGSSSSAAEVNFKMALAALQTVDLIDVTREGQVWLHPQVRALIRHTTPGYDAVLAQGAAALVGAYCSPDVLHTESRTRGFLALVQDLHQTRRAVAVAGTSEPELNRLARLFEWEAVHLGDWRGNGHEGGAYLLQHIRDRAHHQGYDSLRSACDVWLAQFPHLQVEKAWHFPRDPAPLGVLRGPAHPLLCVTALRDGRRALSASDDSLIQLWDVETGELLRVLAGHEGPVYGMVVLRDGRRMLSASDDQTLRLWDIETGETLRVFEGHSAGVRSVTVLPDDRRALSASWDSTLRLWDIETGATLRVLSGHSQSVNAAVLLPDGWRALSASFDRTLRLWDIETGETLSVLSGHQGLVLSVAITPDGCCALSASNDRAVRVWNLTEGTVDRVLTGHAGSVSDVATLPDGRHALSASADRTLRLWDIETGETLRILRGHQGPINAVAALPDGLRAISASEDGALRLWSVDVGGAVGAYDRDLWSVRSLAVLPRRGQILSALFDGRLQVWDVDSGMMQPIPQEYPDPVLKVATLPDEQRALSALSEGLLLMWDIATGETRRILRGHTLGVLDMAPLPDGRRVLTASYDGTLRLWDLRTGETVRLLQDHADIVYSVAVLPDSLYALSASYDATLRLWSLETGNVVRVLRGHQGAVLGVAALPDGRHALSAAHDGTLRLWDLQTGETRHVLHGHAGPVRGLAVLSNQWAVSGSADGTLRLWDLGTGKMLTVLHVAEGPVCLAAVDAARIAVGDNAGGVRVLRAHAPAPVVAQ